MIKYILGFLLMLSFMGCSEEIKYPRYYLGFNSDLTKWYSISAKYDSGQCAGAIGFYTFRDDFDQLRYKLRYEKPTIFKCEHKHKCYEYKICEVVK